MDGITDWMDMGLSKFQEVVRDREACRVAVQVVAKSQTRLGNKTGSSKVISNLVKISTTHLCPKTKALY